MNPEKRKYHVRPMALVVLILIGLPGIAWTKNLRLAGTIGYTPVNEAADGNGIITGGGVHLAYPVSDPGETVHTEFSINNWYSFLPGNEYMHCLRFGFGIRVFYNGFGVVLPYFTHDILTHILWIEGREGYAPTYGRNRSV